MGKVVIQTELYQLPAPLFEKFQDDTKATLFSYREFKKMDTQEKIQAIYLHSVLCYLNKKLMSNGSLRERLGIEVKNRAVVSRVIKQALIAGKIKPYDKYAGSKAMRYVPWWV